MYASLTCNLMQNYYFKKTCRRHVYKFGESVLNTAKHGRRLSEVRRVRFDVLKACRSVVEVWRVRFDNRNNVYRRIVEVRGVRFENRKSCSILVFFFFYT